MISILVTKSLDDRVEVTPWISYDHSLYMTSKLCDYDYKAVS